MSVGFCIGSVYYPIGTGDFLYSFFSTVAYHLENRKWGSEYPHIMKELYSGILPHRSAKPALKELSDIKIRLSELPTDKVVWDIEDFSRKPPWGDNIADTITDLGNYFVTNDGQDFIEVVEKALTESQAIKEDVVIQ
jgi:hypothetical protein